MPCSGLSPPPALQLCSLLLQNPTASNTQKLCHRVVVTHHWKPRVHGIVVTRIPSPQGSLKHPRPPSQQQTLHGISHLWLTGGGGDGWEPNRNTTQTQRSRSRGSNSLAEFSRMFSGNSKVSCSPGEGGFAYLLLVSC